MKTATRNTLIVVNIAAGLYCAHGSAQEVQFFDGGYAELCAMAARNNSMANMPEPVELTGSRLGIEPVEICTLAIRTADSSMNRAASYNNRGVMLFAQGLIAESLADFEEAIRVDDSLAQAYVNRGYTLIALMRWADSIEAFDRGISLGSEEQAKAHFNRGIAHEELGHVREAYQDYLKASELDPLWEEPKQELTRFSVRPRNPGGG
jgi:tetratricopeptide (TPR) repeat protein